ncbi:MAG: nucleotidyltransferase family protein [Candidatus Bipolaricaulota bacterium]|nr:nucleotidyltransferase family protein [Candidatus Bipolaricaulota bacterium]
MDERDAVLEELAKHRSDLSRLGVKSLALFGSTARGEARADSDVDLLVDFSRPVGLFAFLELKGYLERLLARPVDLVTLNALRSDFRETVLREAIYAP